VNRGARGGLVVAGVFGAWLGVFVELLGLLEMTDPVSQSLCGWFGGILLVLGLTAVGVGGLQKPTVIP